MKQGIKAISLVMLVLIMNSTSLLNYFDTKLLVAFFRHTKTQREYTVTPMAE